MAPLVIWAPLSSVFHKMMVWNSLCLRQPNYAKQRWEKHQKQTEGICLVHPKGQAAREHSHVPGSISPTGPYCLMRTENFFGDKYHQCGKCFSCTMNWKSSFTLSGEDFMTSKQHFGLCELLNENCQEPLNSVWSGTTLNMAGKTLCQKLFFKKRIQKIYYAQFQRWYRLQCIRTTSTLEKLMLERYFKNIFQMVSVT